MLKSKLFINTKSTVSKDIVFDSHRLMIKAGLVVQLSSGLYAWMPLGLIVLRKIETIIRKELNRMGAQECLFPILQSKDLLLKTKRWEDFGSLLFKVNDRKNRQYCLFTKLGQNRELKLSICPDMQTNKTNSMVQTILSNLPANKDL